MPSSKFFDHLYVLFSVLVLLRYRSPKKQTSQIRRLGFCRPEEARQVAQHTASTHSSKSILGFWSSRGSKFGLSHCFGYWLLQQLVHAVQAVIKYCKLRIRIRNYFTAVLSCQSLWQSRHSSWTTKLVCLCIFVVSNFY